VVKRIVWFPRSGAQTDALIDAEIRRNLPDLPEGPPKEGWQRNVSWGIEISNEQFPGSKPVWIWEE
jgi:hypothetical protein